MFPKIRERRKQLWEENETRFKASEYKEPVSYDGIMYKSVDDMVRQIGRFPKDSVFGSREEVVGIDVYAALLDMDDVSSQYGLPPFTYTTAYLDDPVYEDLKRAFDAFNEKFGRRVCDTDITVSIEEG